MKRFLLVSKTHLAFRERKLRLHSFVSKMSEGSCGHVYWWYLRFTAIGGLSQAGGTEHKLNHLVWLILTLVGGGLTCWNVYQVVADYLSNDVRNNCTLL